MRLTAMEPIPAQRAQLTASALHATTDTEPEPHRDHPSTATAVVSSIDSQLINPPFDARHPALPPISPLLHSWLRPYTPGPLTEAELQQYQQWGYCIKRNVLSDDELLPAMKAVERQVDEVASALYEAGLIQDRCERLDLFHRLTALERQYPNCSVLLHKLGVLDPGIARLWEQPTLLAIAQQVLGPDVAAHPNWSLRSKTPHQEQATVPWHQDSAYLEPDADNTLQMTAWMSHNTHTPSHAGCCTTPHPPHWMKQLCARSLCPACVVSSRLRPFIDATVENGCMQVLRGGHRAGVTVGHIGCSGATWYIETDESQMPNTLQLDVASNTVTLPVRRGDVLLLNNLVPHRSLPNNSTVIRWSIDLRWQDSSKASGYHAKSLLPLTKRDSPDYRPQWDEWAQQDRQKMVADKAAANSLTSASRRTSSTRTSSGQTANSHLVRTARSPLVD